MTIEQKTAKLTQLATYATKRKVLCPPTRLSPLARQRQMIRMQQKVKPLILAQ